MFGTYLIFVYFLIEYGKPSFLSAIRPGLVLEIVVLVHMFSRRERLATILKDRIIVLALPMFALMIYHGPTASNNFWALKRFEYMLVNIMFMVYICFVVDSPEKLFKVVAAYILLHVVVSVQEVMMGGRYYLGSTGSLGDTNDLAAAMNVVIPVSFYMGFSGRGIRRCLYWIFVIILVLGNVYSFSRGGFAGLCAVLVTIILLSHRRIIVLAILAAMFSICLFFIPEAYLTEMKTIVTEGADSGTGRQRIELWKIAWETFRHNPVLGVGQGNLEWVYERYQDPNSDYWKRGVGGKSVHSIYLTLLAELGIVGTLIFLLMLLNIFTKYRKTRRIANRAPPPDKYQEAIKHVNNGLFAGLIGYMVSGIFLSSFYYPQIWNLFGLITSTYLIAVRQLKMEEGAMGISSATATSS